MEQSKTLTDLFDYVYQYVPKDGPKPNQRQVLDLMNMALKELIGPTVSWSNTEAIATNRVDVPVDLRTLRRVIYKGEMLRRTTEKVMYEMDPSWKETTGDPEFYIPMVHCILLDRIPTSCSAGDLVVEGEGDYPPFSLVEGAENPLDQMQLRHQMGPAEFAIANLPLVGDQVFMARQQKAESRWQQIKRNHNFESKKMRGEVFSVSASE